MAAVVHRAGEGETLFGGRIVLKAAFAQLTITESWFAAARPGAGLHLHRHHVDSFYVLEGELGVTIEGSEHLLGPGWCACAPAGVVHAFRSTAAARFLNVHTPDGGFAGNLRALDRGEPGGFDSVDVEAECERSGAAVFPAGEVRIEREELSLAELVLEPGFEQPEHVSDRQANACYVLDGEVGARIGDEWHALEAGSFAAVPPGLPYGLSSRRAARVLTVQAPG